MTAKIIHLNTQYDNSQDTEKMLELSVGILNDVAHSFTFQFDKCSYLSCSAIALMGAIASLTSSLYLEEKKKVLARKDFPSLLQREVASIFKHLLDNKHLRPLVVEKLNEIKARTDGHFTMNESVQLILQDLFNNQEVVRFIINLVQENNADKIGVMFNVGSMSNQLKNQLLTATFYLILLQNIKTHILKEDILALECIKMKIILKILFSILKMNGLLMNG